MLKRAEVIAVREIYQGSLLVIFARFLRLFEKKFFRKFFVKSKKSDRFQPEKFTNQSSNSIRYCKTALLIYSRSSSLSNAGPFLTQPVGINLHLNNFQCYNLRKSQSSIDQQTANNYGINIDFLTNSSKPGNMIASNSQTL